MPRTAFKKVLALALLINPQAILAAAPLAATVVGAIGMIGLSQSARAAPEDSLDSDLINEELSNELGSSKPGATVEAPPPAEYPYPGASEEGYAGSQPKPSQPSEATNEMPESPDDSHAPRRNSSDNQVRRPASIGKDGTYFYGKELEKVQPHPAPGIEAPIRADEQGQYFYKDDPSIPKASGSREIQQPTTITSSGEYIYKVPRVKATTSASVRLGMLSPPSMHNSEADISFQDIYGKTSMPLVIGDYEWRLTSKVGRLGVKFSTGIATASGQGRFGTSGEEGRPSVDALEKYTFLVFPNQGTAVYKFQYADNQIFVPYVEGGAGYFTFAELRSDNKAPKFGGAPVLVAAAGANILLDWIDKRAIHQLDADYGVSHVWLTGEYRQLVGLRKDLDFTSNTINVGFMMEF